MSSTSVKRAGALPDGLRLFRYAVYAFMISMPWAAVFVERVNPHDVARMFQSLVMGMAACAMAWLGGPWWPRAASGRVAFAGALVLGGLSVMTAPLSIYAALEASSILLLLIVSVTIARTDSETLVRELPPVIALSALLAVLLELPRLVYFLADARVPQAADFGFMYMSHRFFNHAQSMMLPLAFLPLLMPCPRWVRVAAWIGVVGGLALLWRTGGRGTLVAMVVFAVALPWALRPHARQVIRTLTMALFGASAAYMVCFVLPGWLLGLAPDHRGNAAIRIVAGDDSGRFYLWKLALDDALQHPLLGIGPMHYAHQPNLLAAHPHNSVAQWAAEWGVPVTVIAFGTVAVLLAHAAKQARHATTVSSTTILLAVAGLATLAGVIDSLVSGTLVMPVSETWWFIALGCMLAGSRTAPSTAPLAGGALRWTLVAALLASHAGLSVVTYQRSVEPPQSAPNDGPQRTNVPRYWINGFF